MKRASRVGVVLIGLMLLVSCVRNNAIEGVWQGKELDKFGGGTFAWEITFTKVGNEYGGQLVVSDENVTGNASTLDELKIDGQKISFRLGQTKCEGTFTGNNSRLNGRCLFNLESIPNGLQKGEEMKVFELTKK